MNTTAPSRVSVVKKEEKEAKLTEFIRAALTARVFDADSAPVDCCLVVARSPESPIIRALATLASDLMSAGIPVKTIFAGPEVADGLASVLPQGFEARVLKGSGFLEGHEQLVLGPTTVWIGDCMRREPGKRDAFEFYANDCSQSSSWARISFMRLWPMGRTVPLASAPVPLVETAEPSLAPGAIPPAPEDAKPTVSTRH